MLELKKVICQNSGTKTGKKPLSFLPFSVGLQVALAFMKYQLLLPTTIRVFGG